MRRVDGMLMADALVQLLLLTEILKDAQIGPHVLLKIIVEYSVEPRWSDIPLPPGRSLRSCQTLYQALQGLQPYATVASPYVAATTGRKRGGGFHDAVNAAAANRALQPRPLAYASVNGEQGTLMPAPSIDPSAEPPKKKRGRPSRAESDARAAAAAARGEPYPPAKSPRTPRPAKGASHRAAEKASAVEQQQQQQQQPYPPPPRAQPLQMGNFAAPVAMPMGLIPSPATAAAGDPSALMPIKKKRGRPTKAEAAEKLLLKKRQEEAEAAEAENAAVTAQNGQTMPEGEEVELNQLTEDVGQAFGGGDEDDAQMADSMGMQSSTTF
ncbi:MAG: hypothetical protein M1826_003522 [Phylliscum demangeonii]|nr:MAG: hypothetical protein M1826_003522 [Phylliscum demangeonii]